VSASRAEAERRGRRGEALAAWWLRLQGWRVLARRQKIGAGEVDLVVRRGRMVAFVEVKWRATDAELDLAIDARRLARVARAAEVLSAKFVGPRDDMRIDVLLLAPGHWPRHIVNAWQP
jgi:putative endonuclease